MHLVYCIWIYKTQLPSHTQKQITEIQIIPFTIASKKKIHRNKFKQGVERSMYENIQEMHERNVYKTQKETYFIFIDWKN